MNNIESSTGEIVMYQPDETIRLEVRVEDDTVWLNRQQMATLFGRDVKTIGKHVNNALHEELANVPTVANFAIVQNEGGRIVNRTIEFYSIDMIMKRAFKNRYVFVFCTSSISKPLFVYFFKSHAFLLKLSDQPNMF